MGDNYIIVDNNMENSDWIKKFRLDVPGIETFSDAENFLSVPQKNGEDRNFRLKNVMKNYQWVDALPVFEQPIIKEEITNTGDNNEKS